MSTLEDRASAIDAATLEQIASAAATVDRERRFPTESIEILGAQGALGLLAPAEHGGGGAGLLTLADACTQIGAACASTAMVFLMHSVTVATVAGGDGPHAASLLRAMAAGRLGTLAFSERGTGAHFYTPELQATRGDAGLRISGRKSFVTSGGHADVYLVLVRSADGDGLDCYAVEREQQGLRFDGEWQGLGMAGNSSIAIEFDDALVAQDARIGAAGAGGDLVFGIVAPVFLAGLAAVNVGIATAALDRAIEHARTRRYGDGSLLAEVQVIQHQLADMDTRVRAARLLVRDAAALVDTGDEGALVPLMEAKVAATDAAATVTRQALEVCGGQGYTSALPVERHLRDAHAGAVMAPTNSVLRTWTGKALAGLPVP